MSNEEKIHTLQVAN